MCNNKRMRNVSKLMILLTVISGVLSGATLLALPFAMQFGPGFFFGIASSIALHKARQRNLPQLLLWVSASICSWFAVFNLYASFSNNGEAGTGIGVFLACGALGSLLLAIAHAVIFRESSLLRGATVVLAGSVAAIAMNFILQNDSLPVGSFEVAFAIWQVSVGVALIARSHATVR
jgi:hypothetical protein